MSKHNDTPGESLSKEQGNGKKIFTMTSDKLAAFEGRKKHSEVLADLLEEIQPVNFGEYLELPEGEAVKQKHIIVAVVKNIQEVAENKQWNLAQRYDYTYVYNGAFWQQLDKGEMKTFLGKAAIKMGSPEYEARHYEFKDKLLKQFLTDAHLPVPINDPGRILINLQNGTFEFTQNGWKLRDFNPNDFLTYQLPFEYNVNNTCPLFDKYLLRVLPDESSRNILQEFSGYIFTKMNLEKMLVLTGTGANGKSVFFNIISALIGKENLLTYPMGLFSSEYNRAKLTNVLVNYSSEKGADLNPDTFKALISGEPLQARNPYGNAFTLYNIVRFIINANELPKKTEHTEAFYRRYLIVPFEVQIPENERDIELADKIINQELAGVFNWLLVGLNRIVKEKEFSRCDKADMALSEFKSQSDTIALFIDEYYYKPSDKNKVALSELYYNYKSFCKNDECVPLRKNQFSVLLENKGFERTRLTGGHTAFFITGVIGEEFDDGYIPS